MDIILLAHSCLSEIYICSLCSYYWLIFSRSLYLICWGVGGWQDVCMVLYICSVRLFCDADSCFFCLCGMSLKMSCYVSGGSPFPKNCNYIPSVWILKITILQHTAPFRKRVCAAFPVNILKDNYTTWILVHTFQNNTEPFKSFFCRLLDRLASSLETFCYPKWSIKVSF